MSLQETLAGLEAEKGDYVWYRSQCNTDAEAYRDAGVSKSTFYRWEDRDDLNKLADELRAERRAKAEMILERSLVKAAEIKVKGLDSRKEDTRLATASEILDRVLGRATQRQEIAGPGGDALTIVIKPRDGD
jgi:hypothetical protein